MRKLGRRMNMTAKTVYNYFVNKNEIYLHLLTKGFELLYADILAAHKTHSDP